MGIYKLECLEIIPPRVTSNVHHEYPHPLHLKKLGVGVGQPHRMVITIAIYPAKGLEGGNSIGSFNVPEITGMPYFIYRLQKLAEFVIKNSVGIRYQSYISHTVRLSCNEKVKVLSQSFSCKATLPWR